MDAEARHQSAGPEQWDIPRETSPLEASRGGRQ